MWAALRNVRLLYFVSRGKDGKSNGAERVVEATRQLAVAAIDVNPLHHSHLAGIAVVWKVLHSSMPVPQLLHWRCWVVQYTLNTLSSNVLQI